MHKSLTTALIASVLAVGAPFAYSQTMVQPPSRSSNDLSPNGGVNEGSAPPLNAMSNRERQREFNRTYQPPYDTTAQSNYNRSLPRSSADPAAPYEGSRESNSSGPRP